jgi:hypothetical protein
MGPGTLARLLFALPGAAFLVTGIASLVPMDTGVAGGVGLLLLVPLFLAAIPASLAGMAIALSRPGDGMLWLLALLLAALFVLMVFVLMVLEPLPPGVANTVSLGGGLLVLLLALGPLAIRRWR